MSAEAIAWAETAFNVAYLIAIWAMVALMTRRLPLVAAQDRATAGLVRVAFLLLAAGDTGHVGFRVVAQLMGGAESQTSLFGTPMSLVGLGSLATAVTVTFFYMVLVYVWRARFRQPANAITGLALAAGVVRLVLMAMPGNEWGSSVPPAPMGLVRNLPLMVQGACVIYLFLKSAYPAGDAIFRRIGWWIVVSFAFYLPVILFVRQVPLIGMLMIPKTCAYLAVAWVAYRGLWQPLRAPEQSSTQPGLAAG